MYKLISLFILRQKSRIEKHASHTLIIINKTGIVFSFFKQIYIDKTFIKQAYQHILSHELIHIRQYHSLDLLLFEILKIINWFNPAIYVFQHRITELHEFIADEKTIAPENKSDFFNRLLTTTFKVTKVDFINQFYKQSLIKNRIIMTNKNKSKQVLKLKYLLLVPVLGSMLFFVSCQQKKQTVKEQVAALKASIVKKEPLSSSELEEIRSLATKKSLFIKNLSITDTTIVEVEEVFDVPFAIIEQAPIYPGCEDALNKKKCTSNKISILVNKKFNVKLPKELGLTPGRKRIFVMFKIDKTGKVVDVRARGPHKKLAAEATRVVKLIPQMVPGKQRGKVVAVKYSLPIVFNVPK